MGGTTTSPTEQTTFLRKIRKPLIEKMRRKRMNQSIDQLKDLITDTIKDNVAPMTRVDKADILELTVAHLTQASQRQHRNVTAETSTSGYSHGYQDCSQDIINFLASNSLVNGATLNCLNTFMNSSYLHQSGNGQTSRLHSRSEIYCSTPMRHQSVEIRKPLIEKMRRKRMNQSIDQLKDLITDTIKENVAPMTRVDKADILELTVAHLTQVNQRQEQRNVSPETSTTGYSHGYRDCSQDIINFLTTNTLVNGATLDCLTAYMKSSHVHATENRQTSILHSPSEMYCSTPMISYSLDENTTIPAQLTSCSPILQSITNVSDVRRNVSTCSTSSSLSSSVTDSSGDSESYSSMDYRSIEAQSSCRHHSSDVVSISEGTYSAIGHMTKDTTWRPW